MSRCPFSAMMTLSFPLVLSGFFGWYFDIVRIETTNARVTSCRIICFVWCTKTCGVPWIWVSRLTFQDIFMPKMWHSLRAQGRNSVSMVHSLYSVLSRVIHEFQWNYFEWKFIISACMGERFFFLLLGIGFPGVSLQRITKEESELQQIIWLNRIEGIHGKSSQRKFIELKLRLKLFFVE